MTIDEMIQVCVQKLPPKRKAEVFDFVQYLLTKTEHGSRPNDDEAPVNLSLTLAMRGMEEVTVLEYTEADLKIIFA